MSRSILQVPVNPQLRKAAEKEALHQGFSSLQEAVRLFLNKLAEKKIGVAFEEPPVQLSPRAVKRYDKMADDIVSGKVKTQSFTDTESLMKFLHDED